MYDLQGYAGMIHDARRIQAYQRALQRAVKPGSVVVDIGTGLGIFSFLACQAGARKVYAIEPDEVIAVARQLSELNGFGDRIQFIEDISSRVTLPEPADVIVSDLSGAIPVFGQHVPTILDARKRFLKPGGTLIPVRDTMWAGVVNAAAFHAKIAPPTDRIYGLDMRPAWNMAANICSNKSFTELVTTPQLLGVLEFSEIEDPNFRTKVTCVAKGSGTGHGISMWFERTLAEGIAFSTKPGEPEMVYGRLFLPWPEPVDLQEGDTVDLDLRADFRDDAYIWSWSTKISGGTRETKTFRQSDFYGEPRSETHLRKQRATHVPVLNEAGESDRVILQLMDGTNAVEDIARVLQERFPERYETLEKAVGYVAGVSDRYSK
jgi:protein arginine N-methyltransferase 1